MNIIYKKFVLVVVLIVISSLTINAQKPRFKFKTFTQADGLVNHTIQDILEDSYGFLWIATQQGLQRYDGRSFKTFDNSNGIDTGLVSNFISALCEDRDGDIWIGTQGGVSIYDRKTEVIRAVKLDFQSLFGGVSFITDIITDRIDSSKIWLASTGFVKYDKHTREYEYVKTSDNPLLNGTQKFLEHPGKKNILFFGYEKLQMFNTENNSITELYELEQNTNPPDNFINDLIVDPGNNDLIWLATGDFWGQGNIGGLVRYNIRTGNVKIFSSSKEPNSLLTNNLLSLQFYDNDNLWIGTRSHALQLFNKKENKFYQYTKKDWNPQSFGSSQAVLEIFKDNSGSFWFGTWGEGIPLLSSTSTKFSHYYKENDNRNSLPGNYVNTFTEDYDEKIWVGTRNGGLTRFDPIAKNFRHFLTEQFMGGGDPVVITYLFYDSRQNLWIGTHRESLYRLNPKSGKHIHYKVGSGKDMVSAQRITTVSEPQYGKIYITTYGGGLNIYDYGTDSFTHYLNDPDDSTSIPDNQMWLPFTDEKGNVYFSGNNNTGLFKFDPESEKFDNLDYTLLSTFTSPYRNSEGKIFANALATGMVEIIPGDSATVKIILDNNGNQIKNVEAILEDSQQNLWLSTTNGLLQFDPETGIIKKYGPEDGLQGEVFNRLAAFKSSTGEMYFGGTNGFTVFHPDDIKLSNFKPPVLFTDFKLFNESVKIGEDNAVKQSLLVENNIKLDYDQNDFSISFASLDFANPSKIRYKYQLENHNTNWVVAGNSSTATYTNMDPGEYTFRVLATNSDGIWLDTPSELNLVIYPPIWRTTGAYIFYMLFLVGAVFTFDRFQRRRLIVKERTASQIREAELRAQLAESESERKTVELEEARQLQLSMLPKELPKLPNLDIAVFIQTATEVGGDYYDFHHHPDGTLTVILGDATGHGMQSGMMVSIMKSLFMSDRSNKELKPFFNNTSASIKDMQLGRLLMALACVQINSNKIKIANAGMPPLYIYRHRSGQVEEIAINNVPLGAMKTFDYEVREEKIETGDTILLMSDGFAELSNSDNEQFGYPRAKTLFEKNGLKDPADIISILKEEGQNWINGQDPEDDVTFVVIKVK